MIISRTARGPRLNTVLACFDVGLVGAALLSAASLRFGLAGGLRFAQEHVPALLASCVVFSVCFYVGGLYQRAYLRRRNMTVLTAGGAVATASILVAAVLRAPFAGLGRGLFVGFACAVLAGIVGARLAYMEAARRGWMDRRCLIVGAVDQAREILELVESYANPGFKVIGVVQCGGRRPGADRLAGEYPVLGTLDALDRLVEEHDVDRLILAASVEDEPVLLRRLRPFRYRGMGLIDVVSLYEELAAEIPLHRIDDDWLFRAATGNSLFHVRRIKRVMDVAVALAIFVPALLLVLPLAALAIKLTSNGPLLFRQERLGLDSRAFHVLKLRTMRADAEKLTGPVWSAEDDPRITRVGRFLRKYRIDELPQLWNVLRGEMSLVGPRPERAVFTRKLAEELPFFEERLLVRPGITGWAQVMAPYAASVEDTRRKLQFDLYYIKNMSFFLDVLVIAKTARTMLFGREREQGGIVTSAGSLLSANAPEISDSFALSRRGRAASDS